MKYAFHGGMMFKNKILVLAILIGGFAAKGFAAQQPLYSHQAYNLDSIDFSMSPRGDRALFGPLYEFHKPNFVELIDNQTGALIARHSIRGMLQMFTFNPDGSRYYVYSKAGKITVYDSKDGTELHSYCDLDNCEANSGNGWTYYASHSFEIKFSRDGSHFLTHDSSYYVGYEGALSLRTADGVLKLQISAKDMNVLRAGFTSDSKLMWVSELRPGSPVLFYNMDGKLEFSIQTSSNNSLVSADKQGKYFGISDSSGFHLYNNDGTKVRDLPQLKGLQGVRFSPDGTKLSAFTPGIYNNGEMPAKLKIFDLLGNQIAESRDLYYHGITTGEFTPDSQSIVMSDMRKLGGNKTDVIQWNFLDNTERVLLSFPYWYAQVNLSPDSKQLMVYNYLAAEGLNIYQCFNFVRK